MGGSLSRAGPGPPNRWGRGELQDLSRFPETRDSILSSEMPEDFKKKGVCGGERRSKGSSGTSTLLLKGRKMQGSTAFFSICSLAIPLENFKRHAV